MSIYVHRHNVFIIVSSSSDAVRQYSIYLLTYMFAAISDNRHCLANIAAF